MKKRVLVADDSITIQKVVELSLSESYEVRCAANGAQAIELFEDYRPDIVLCDALMPEKDGYEVCAFVKGHAQLGHTPVLLLHGAFESFDEARARDVGADETLTKPFDTQTLIDMVGKLLAQIEQPSAEAAPQEEAPPQEVVAKVEEDVESAFGAFEEKAGPAEKPSAPEPGEPPEAEETMAIPVPTMQSLIEGAASQAEPPKEASEAAAAETEPSYRGETVAVPRRELAQAIEEEKSSESVIADPEAPEESPAEASGASPAEAYGASPAESGASAPAEDVASELDAELADMDFGGDEEGKEPSPVQEETEPAASEEPIAPAQEEPLLEAGAPSESATAAEEAQPAEEAEEAAPPPLPSEPTLDVSQEAIPAESAPPEEAVKEPVETQEPARAEEEGAPLLGEESAEQAPEAYYEPPQGVTENDRAFAREMAESSSVSATEMLGEEAKKAPAEEPQQEEQAPAAEEEEKAQTGTEEMPTAELLKEVGEPSAPSARELLNEEEIQKVVERAVKRISEKMLREIAWEVVPDLAEVLIRKKIEEIEKDAEKKK